MLIKEDTIKVGQRVDTHDLSIGQKINIHDLAIDIESGIIPRIYVEDNYVEIAYVE